MPNLGAAEIIAILVVALVVLGPKRLPEVGRKIGGFVRQLRTHSDSVKAELRDVIDIDGVTEGVNSVRRDLKEAVSIGPVFADPETASTRTRPAAPPAVSDEEADALPRDGAAGTVHPMMRALSRGATATSAGSGAQSPGVPTRRLPGVAAPAGDDRAPGSDSGGRDVTRRLPADGGEA